MAVPGLLIEYLISGSLALIWLFPLLRKSGLAEVNSAYLALFALGLYFVGMVVDIAAWAVTRPIKHKIRERIEKKYSFERKRTPGSSHRRQVKFAMYAPDVAKESAMRSSRDRIARGAIVNSIMATIFVLPLFLGLTFILISFVMWIGFEQVSYGYELSAERAVDEKIENDRIKIRA